MAAVVGAFIADQSGQNAVDDGTTATLETNLISSVGNVAKSAIPIASQAEAEAGTENTKRMTPLRVAQAIAAQVTKGFMPKSTIVKSDNNTPCLIKTGAGALSIKAGTTVYLESGSASFVAQTAVSMPTLAAGTDYSVWVKPDGTAVAVADPFTAPASPPTVGALKIGGFHYGLVPSDTTVAGGSFATTGNGMIWTQAAVDDIAGINRYSIWDLKFRPLAADPRGMTLVGGKVWVDIYLCSTDTATYGTSSAGTNIASGTVLPKIPAAFGGNGTTTYPTLNWWVANELARANQKRLMWEHEFVEAAFGVTENQSIDATASTYPATQRNAGYTSKYGLEQASGHHHTWGQDTGQSYDTTTWDWKDLNGNNGAGTGRGQIYTQGTYGLTRVLLGGARTLSAYSGSRASFWNRCPWHSNWGVGLRAACDHLMLV